MDFKICLIKICVIENFSYHYTNSYFNIYNNHLNSINQIFFTSSLYYLVLNFYISNLNLSIILFKVIINHYTHFKEFINLLINHFYRYFSNCYLIICFIKHSAFKFQFIIFLKNCLNFQIDNHFFLFIYYDIIVSLKDFFLFSW